MDERNDYNSIPMQPIQTAVDWIIEQLIPKDQHEGIIDIIEQAKQIEKEQIIDFHNWMMKNDTPENAERYFHYTDNDMLNEYLNQNNL
jgi:hypothetical protein